MATNPEHKGVAPDRITTRRAEVVRGLRELADFIESRIDLPVPCGETWVTAKIGVLSPWHNTPAELGHGTVRDAFEHISRTAGPLKQVNDPLGIGTVELQRTFPGDVRIDYSASIDALGIAEVKPKYDIPDFVGAGKGGAA